MNSKKVSYVWSAVWLALFVILIVLLKSVNVTNEGYDGSAIGLASINVPVHNLFGVNDTMYSISKYLGILLIAAALFTIAFDGIKVLIAKSLSAISKQHYCLIGLYGVMVVLYLAFDHIVINYRPVLKAGETEPEASFPSTHALLAYVIGISLCSVVGEYIHDEKICRLVKLALIVVTILVIVCRLLSGVHWFTDIIGGVLLGACLVSIYRAMYICTEE